MVCHHLNFKHANVKGKMKYELTFPLPHLTSVPMKATFFTDPSSPAFITGSGIFREGSVSPVKLLSSIDKSIA